jgi:hypothetical protein
MNEKSIGDSAKTGIRASNPRTGDTTGSVIAQQMV